MVIFIMEMSHRIQRAFALIGVFLVAFWFIEFGEGGSTFNEVPTRYVGDILIVGGLLGRIDVNI